MQHATDGCGLHQQAGYTGSCGGSLARAPSLLMLTNKMNKRNDCSTTSTCQRKLHAPGALHAVVQHTVI